MNLTDAIAGSGLRYAYVAHGIGEYVLVDVAPRLALGLRRGGLTTDLRIVTTERSQPCPEYVGGGPYVEGPYRGGTIVAELAGVDPTPVTLAGHGGDTTWCPLVGQRRALPALRRAGRLRHRGRRGLRDEARRAAARLLNGVSASSAVAFRARAGRPCRPRGSSRASRDPCPMRYQVASGSPVACRSAQRAAWWGNGSNASGRSSTRALRRPRAGRPVVAAIDRVRCPPSRAAPPCAAGGAPHSGQARKAVPSCAPGRAEHHRRGDPATVHDARLPRAPGTETASTICGTSATRPHEAVIREAPAVAAGLRALRDDQVDAGLLQRDGVRDRGRGADTGARRTPSSTSHGEAEHRHALVAQNAELCLASGPRATGGRGGSGGAGRPSRSRWRAHDRVDVGRIAGRRVLPGEEVDRERAVA